MLKTLNKIYHDWGEATQFTCKWCVTHGILYEYIWFVGGGWGEKSRENGERRQKRENPLLSSFLPFSFFPCSLLHSVMPSRSVAVVHLQDVEREGRPRVTFLKSVAVNAFLADWSEWRHSHSQSRFITGRGDPTKTKLNIRNLVLEGQWQLCVRLRSPAEMGWELNIRCGINRPSKTRFPPVIRQIQISVR